MKTWFKLFIPLLILIVLIIWRLDQKKAETGDQMTQQMSRSGMPAFVELTSPEVRDIVNTFVSTGTVEPIQNVKISPKVTGRVDYLEVREGDHVRQGQVLVRIDQSQVQAEVRRERAALAEAKYRLAQAQLTQSTTDTSVATQLRQQQANLESAQADLIQAEKTRNAQYETAKALIDDALNKIEAANASAANAQANIRSAQANLNNAQAKYDRTVSLYEKGFVSTQAVDDAKTALDVQQSALEVAKGQLQSSLAAVKSAQSQKKSAEEQAKILKAKADADLEAAKAKVSQAKAALEYAQANLKQSPAYRQSIEALKSSVEAAEASLDSAIAKLEDTVLRSPIDGVVTERNLDPGSLATAGQPILVVQAMNKVWVTVAVPEYVSINLHINQTASVTFDSLGGQTFTARIAQINPSADLESRQYLVRTILDNSSGRLTAGMFAKVVLETGKSSRVQAIPLEAVKKAKDGSSYVIVAGTDNKAKYCPVVTGVSDSKWVAVLSGLKLTDKVVTMSASSVRDGQMLKTGKGRRGPSSAARPKPGEVNR